MTKAKQVVNPKLFGFRGRGGGGGRGVGGGIGGGGDRYGGQR